MTLILIADDDSGIRETIKMSLFGMKYVFREASTLEEIEKEIGNYQFDLLLLDIHFGSQTSINLLKKIHEAGKLPPTIILSGAATAKEAADSIRFGAYDYLEKPITSDKLKVSISNCLDRQRLNLSFQTLVKPASPFSGYLGVSQSANDIRSQIKQYASRDVKVLITGETGTGKEIVAKEIWQQSTRTQKPFIVINSSAIPDELIESELFGHKKGSFTGAISEQIGKIEMADRGTLFLDEVGDLSVKAQVKLLRFLETDEIQPIGTTSCRKVNVRIIAATSRNLEEEIKKGHFREDLYYRINVARINIAPLRERKSDIPIFFENFVNQLTIKYELKTQEVQQGVQELLQSYDWPGNVRQLRNAIERIILQANNSISVALTQDVLSQFSKTNNPFTQQQKNLEWISLKDFKIQSEKTYIENALDHCEGNVANAAKILNIDRTYLHQKIHSLAITRK